MATCHIPYPDHALSDLRHGNYSKWATILTVFGGQKLTMANTSRQLRYIIHGVHIVWYRFIWGEDTLSKFIVSRSPTHLRVSYAYKEFMIRRTVYDRQRAHVPRVSCLVWYNVFTVHNTSPVCMQDEDTSWMLTVSWSCTDYRLMCVIESQQSHVQLHNRWPQRAIYAHYNESIGSMSWYASDTLGTSYVHCWR